MRLIVQYVIPLVALALILILILARRKSTRKDDEPLVSGPLLIIVLAISGTIGVFAIVFVMQYLEII